MVVFLALSAFVLVLAAAYVVTQSLNVALVFAAVTAVGAFVVALRMRPGPGTLRGPQHIRSRLEELRDGASAVSAIWSGEYEAAEVGAYFEDEQKALAGNKRLHITRVINPSVIPEEHFDLLQSIRKQFGPRFRLLEDSTIRSFELYIADYPVETGKDAVAVVILNNTVGDRPEVALVLDPKEDKGLGGAVGAVRRWWKTISDDLPAFDPVGLERWEHIAAQYTRLVTENVNQIEFLDRYSTREKQMVSDYLRSAASKGYDISLIEVGCGDGRALFAYIPVELARNTAYVVGLDYAPAMITAASEELRRLQRTGALAPDYSRLLRKNTAFFLLNAEHMRSFFNDGRLNALEQLLEASPSDRVAEIDYSNYATSTKVFCCLLNTIGVIEPENRRVSFVEAMLACLGVNDSLVISVFAAERFAEEAPRLYGGLKEMINTEIIEPHFDMENANFKVAGSPGYFSHWFTERELRKLIDDAAAQLEKEGRHFESVKIEEMGNGGYMATISRSV